MDRSGKLKFAIDVALTYFIIVTVLSAISSILPNLVFMGTRLVSAFGFGLPRFVVSLVVILALAGLSMKLKRKAQADSPDNRLLLYLIVGILLIVSGIVSIPTQVLGLKMYMVNLENVGNLSELNRARLFNGIYTYIVPIVIYVFQIGIGAYFAFVTSRRKGQTEELPKD